MHWSWIFVRDFLNIWNEVQFLCLTYPQTFTNTAFRIFLFRTLTSDCFTTGFVFYFKRQQDKIGFAHSNLSTMVLKDLGYFCFCQKYADMEKSLCWLAYEENMLQSILVIEEYTARYVCSNAFHLLGKDPHILSGYLGMSPNAQKGYKHICHKYAERM